MPHMMPMLWMMLFIMSFTCLYLLIIMIYFFYLPKLKNNKMKIKPSKWNWMW